MKEYIGVIFFLMHLQIANSQDIKFSEPVKLGPEINSENEELAPMLSPDGNTLYFARAFHDKNTGGKYAGTDIWISRKDANGKWLPAVNAGKPWNNKNSNAIIGISNDGNTIYLLNSYNNKSGIAYSKIVHDKWTKPEFVSVSGIDKEDFVGIYVHPDFDVMVVSMKGDDTYGEEDLYVSLKDSLGIWSKLQNLGPTINSSGFEISPFLSKDKRRLFFASNRQSSTDGSNIFYCDRMYDSWQVWSRLESINFADVSLFESSFNMLNDTSIMFSRVAVKDTKADLYSVTIVPEQKIEYSKEVNRLLLESKSLLNEIQSKKESVPLPTTEIIYFSTPNAIDFDSNYTLIFEKFVKYLQENPASKLLVRLNTVSGNIEKRRISLIASRLKSAGVSPSRYAFSDSKSPFELKAGSMELSIEDRKK